MKRQLYICSCYSAEHQMIFNPSPEESEKTIYVHFNLVKRPFFQRLKYALKYVLGYQSKYGAFDELVLDQDHSKQLFNAAQYLDPEISKRSPNQEIQFLPESLISSSEDRKEDLDWNGIFYKIANDLNEEIPQRVKNWLQNKFSAPVLKNSSNGDEVNS